MDLPIRAITRDELPAVQRAMAFAFGSDPVADEQPHIDATMEYERTRCAFDGPEIVGTSGSYTFELAVPGATLPSAGTTLVSVRATHRRRGLLRAMMAAHLRDVEEREEPLAALWASESSIYERFGFGPAADIHHFEVETAHASFRRPVEAPGRCRLVDAEEAGKALPTLYESVWRERPGHFARSPEWWLHRRMYDGASVRDGASSFRFFLYEEAAGPRGYAQFRTKQRWGDSGLPGNHLHLTELVGFDAAARAALWRQLLDVDLVVRLHAWNQPADCELPWLLADSRRAEREYRDALWVRIIDVKRALEGRRYVLPGGVVLGVHDEFRPEASAIWALEAGTDGARCEITTREPDIQLGVSELASVYMGGHRLGALARAGRVEGSPEAIARADALFAWDPAPWCPEIF